MLQILNLTGRPIAGQHDLLVGLVQCIKGVEELFLNTFLAGEELNVVNQQHIGLTVFLAELHQLVFLNGRNVFVGELLGGDVRDLRALLGTGHVLTHRVQQVRLAEPRAAVKEERVVSLAGLLGHSHGSRMREAVVIPHHKRVKRVARVKHQVTVAGLFGGGSFFAAGGFGRGRRSAVAFSHLEFNVQLAAAGGSQCVL